METGVIHIGPLQLAIAFVFVFAAGVTSLVHALRLERDLLIGSLRTLIQLSLLGYVLAFVFKIDNPLPVIGLFLLMSLFAAWTARGRVKERRVSFFWPLCISMILSYSLVSFVVTEVVIGVEPWWRPRYFIPLSGMVVGNSMNAVAVALDRLLHELRERRAEVEMMLCHGADYREASRDMVGNAMRAGMIPSINSMMAAGVVFIPGMMTGQILAGADPLMAVRYQIVVMVMLVGATAIGTLLVVLLVRKRCFGPGQELLLKPGRSSSGP